MNDNKLSKDRLKALGDMLSSECKNPNSDESTLEPIVSAGADVCYAFSKPLKFAAKALNFKAVNYLLKEGALKLAMSYKYVSQMCESKGFNDSFEPQYFELIDYCVTHGGNLNDMLTEYINYSANRGRMDRLEFLMNKYSLSPDFVADNVHIRIIFDLILNAHDAVLQFVSAHRQWVSQESFDLAVYSGDWVVLEYFLHNSSYRKPSPEAVAQSIFTNSFPVLDMLIAEGFSFNKNPFYLKKACRAALGGDVSALTYLLKRGYSVNDKYDGATIKENAEKDGNTAVLEFLKSN